MTKCNIARKVADEGIRVVIANGKRDNILLRLFDSPQETLHTEFVPRPDAISTVKKWIAHSESFAKGVVRINERATEAICSGKATSLLLVGVTAIDGDFEDGDIVNIVTPQGKRIAVGRSAFSSDTAKRLIGQHDQKPLVHYDYLAML